MEDLKRLECPKCGKLLAKILLSPGSMVEIKCTTAGCKELVRVTMEEPLQGTVIILPIS